MIRAYTVQAAAEHFIPRSRYPERHSRLVRILAELWLGSEVLIRRCEECLFAFPVPYVGGTVEFYNLVSGGSPRYPRSRWEFVRTIQSLHRLYPGYPERKASLLESGAGDGSFLRALQGSPLRDKFELLALEFDHAALERLGRAGLRAVQGSLLDLADQPVDSKRFDVICMFQVLEHMTYPEDVFSACRRLARPGAHIFVSVPNGVAVDDQEQVINYWDMPPNHVGRWYSSTFVRFAARMRIAILEHEIQATSRLGRAWHLSMNRTRSRAYVQGTVDELINSIRFRPARGILRLALGALSVPPMVASSRPLGLSQWVHLQLP